MWRLAVAFFVILTNCRTTIAQTAPNEPNLVAESSLATLRAKFVYDGPPPARKKFDSRAV